MCVDDTLFEERSCVWKVEEGEAGLRADVFLTACMECSRSQAQLWIAQRRLDVVEADAEAVWDGGGADDDGSNAEALQEVWRALPALKCLKSSDKLKEGMLIRLCRPPLQAADPVPDPEIKINAVYEDEHLLVLNKDRGVTVHPGSGTHGSTLVNGLLAHCRDLSGIRGVQMPGIVHRLDKDTSGLMVVAKNDAAHLSLTRQFADRTVTKMYRALLHGVPPQSGIIQRPIGRHRTQRKMMAVRTTGRPARTDFYLVRPFGEEYSLVDLHLHTGRTHQIRVHMTYLGYPLVGDTVYGQRPNPWGLEGQALHCRLLAFDHPLTGQRLEFTAPVPQVWQRIVDELAEKFPAPGD